MALQIREIGRTGAFLLCAVAVSGCDGRFGRAVDELLAPLPQSARDWKDPTPPPPAVYDPSVLPGQPTYGEDGALTNRRIYEEVYAQDYSVPITGDPSALGEGAAGELVFLDDPISDRRLSDPSPSLEGAAQDAMARSGLEVAPISTEYVPTERAILGPETSIPRAAPRAALDGRAPGRATFAVAPDDPYASPVPRPRPGRGATPIEDVPLITVGDDPVSTAPRPGNQGYRPLPTPTALPGTSWRLATIAGRAIRGSAELHFDEASGFAGGRAPCNDYGGEFIGGTDGSVALRNIFATERACEFLDEELEFLGALEAARGYRIGDYGLVLTDASGADTVSFVRF